MPCSAAGGLVSAVVKLEFLDQLKTLIIHEDNTHTSNSIYKRRRKNLLINAVCDPKESKVFHKGIVHPVKCLCRHIGDTEVWLHTIRNQALGGGWLVPCSGHFTTRKSLIPNVQKAGCASGLIQMAQKITPHWNLFTILYSLL